MGEKYNNMIRDRRILLKIVYNIIGDRQLGEILFQNLHYGDCNSSKLRHIFTWYFDKDSLHDPFQNTFRNLPIYYDSHDYGLKVFFCGRFFPR